MNISNNSLQRYSDVDALSTQGRIGRTHYFVYSIVLPMIIFWGIASLAGLFSFLPIASTSISYTIIGIAIFAMLLMLVRLTIQRCHDFNQSGALAVLALIPLSNIVFALIPGTNGLNQYGEVPKPANTMLKTVLYALLALFLVAAAYISVQLFNSQTISQFLQF